MGSKSSTESGSQTRQSVKNLIVKFRRQLGRAASPKIEQFLGLVDPSEAEDLFIRLLEIEVTFRQGQGQSPKPADYLPRFPQFRSIIRQTVMESILDSDSHDESWQEESAHVAKGVKVDSCSDDDATTASRLGHYELLGPLGQGAMGIVHEARDSKTGNLVALKVLPTNLDGQSVDAHRLQRFRKEFRSLSKVNHPNLVAMQTLEVDGNQWFLTMELVEGQDFRNHVRPADRLDEGRLRQCLPQLASGIIALHNEGIVHRDLKPTNVLVDRQGRVVILDFGLVAELQQNFDATQTRTGMFVGTIPYASPEQVYGQRTEANDWYALGVMIYEALTGTVPFPGKGQAALFLKQQQDAPSLQQRSEFPNDLAELTDGLLRREVDARWGADEIKRFFGLDTRSTRFRVPIPDSQTNQGSSHSTSDELLEIEHPDLLQTVLIGRETQTAELEETKTNFLERLRPSVVWISGRSGEGKSSLVQQFLRPLQEGTEILVLSGRCYDRESVPFNAIDCIIDPLIRYLRSPEGARLESETLDDIEFLPFVFPAMERVSWIHHRKNKVPRRMDPQQIRGRAFYGFRQLLEAIATRHPIVVHIDDLQWGDADSSRAWYELLNPNASLPLLMLGSYRSDEVKNSPFLENWNQLTTSVFHQLEIRTIAVNPLSLEECLQLATQRTGLDRSSIYTAVEQIFEDTGGNPYLLEQLLEGFDSATVEFRRLSIDEIVAERLDRLPESAGRLLEVVSISGQPIRVSELASVANSKEFPGSTLKRMVNERLIRMLDGSVEPMIETWHDKVRESVVSQMKASRLKKWHLRLAEVIERKEPHNSGEWLEMLANHATPGEFDYPLSDRLLDLSQHFAAAEDPRAFVYQWLAAEQAMQAYAVDEAFELFQHAKRLLPPDSPSTLKFRFWMGFGRVSLWHESPQLSFDAFQNVLKHASNDIEVAEGYAGLQAIEERRGHYDESIRWLECGLQQINFRRPKSFSGRLFSIAKGISIAFLPKSMLESKTELKRRIAATSHDLLQSVYLVTAEKDFVLTIQSVVNQALSGLKSGDASRIAIGQIGIGMIFSSIGIGWLGKFYIHRARKLKGIFDTELEGIYGANIAIGELFLGNLTAAATHFNSSYPHIIRCHNKRSLQQALHMHRHLLAYTGSSDEELEKAQAVLEVGNQTGNVQGICWGSYDAASALARAGNPSESAKHMQAANRALPNEVFLMTWPIRASTEAYIRIQLSDYSGANRLAEYAWSVIKQGWLALDVSLLCLPILLESSAGSDWMTKVPHEYRRSLKRNLRRATMFYLTIPNQQSHIDRVRGRAWWRLGKPRKAIRLFEKAVRTSKQKGMKYQQAKSLLDLAAVKEEGRNQNRAEAICLLKEMKSVIPRAESWLLGDQYDEAVVAPEFDLEAWEQEHGPLDGNEKQPAS